MSQDSPQLAIVTEEIIEAPQTYEELLEENLILKAKIARLSATPHIIGDSVHYHISSLDSDILFESAKKDIDALRLRADMLENACNRYLNL